MQRYLILTLRTPRFDPAVIEPHYAHLDRLRERGMLELFGPFGDKSGGAYLIRAQDLDEARAIAHSDPVHVSGSSRVTVYEWNAKEAFDTDTHG
ncbi:MAG TPA: YciI family protein [Rhodanobacteraceae bacterium]|nr:YciI family protein [Rhodanobacteraceae bacterium]